MVSNMQEDGSGNLRCTSPWNLDQPGTILDFGLLCPAPDAFLAVGNFSIKDTWDLWFYFILCFMEVVLGGVNEYFFLGLEFQLSKSAARGCECLEQEEVRCRVRRITKSHHLSPNFNAHYLQVWVLFTLFPNELTEW